MRVVQIVPTLAYGDAIGNYCLTLSDLLKEHGYNTLLLAKSIHPKIPKSKAKLLSSKIIKKDDIVIYHLAIHDELNEWIASLPCKKIIIYHNITPYHFFSRFNPTLEQLCYQGIEDVKQMASAVDYVIADSSYNKKCLIELGYQCKIDVNPVLLSFDDYDQLPLDDIIQKYNDDYVNFLFVGRVAPNKKIENVILSFYYYKKYIDSKSRLFIVGNYDEKENYYVYLKKYIDYLNIDDVIFTGHISFQELLSYYQIADLFLCMSEHEGFCVPLVEAMYFKIPIVALDTSAIAETLGSGGILLADKNPKLAAYVIKHILNSKDLQNYILEEQKKQLAKFDSAKVEKNLIHLIESYIHEKDGE